MKEGGGHFNQCHINKKDYKRILEQLYATKWTNLEEKFLETCQN